MTWTSLIANCTSCYLCLDYKYQQIFNWCVIHTLFFFFKNIFVVLRPLQRQVLLLMTAGLTVLNGRDMASSCTSQKGQYQQNTQNAELTSKLVSLDSSISQMIYSLLVVYTGYLVLRSLSSLSHLKLSTVHHFRTPLSLQAFSSL